MLKTRLSKRLQEIYEMIDDTYPVGWDLCCDHGKLGLALLEGKKCYKVNFVDQVPGITEELESYISKIPNLNSKSYSIETMDAAKIQPTDKSLVCLCGVGGDVAISILSSIIKYQGARDCTFVISAQYQLFELRRFLDQAGFGLIKERLIFEGKWGYEVLVVKLGERESIDNVGSNLLDLNCPKTIQYFKKLVNHYERKSHSDEESKLILHHYKKLLIGKNLK